MRQKPRPRISPIDDARALFRRAHFSLAAERLAALLDEDPGFAAGALLAALLSRLMKWVGLSWFNHLLGGLAGFLRGVFLVAVLASVLVAFAPSPTPQYLRTSRVLPYANDVAVILAELAPHELKDSFSQQMQNLKQSHAARGPVHDI